MKLRRDRLKGSQDLQNSHQRKWLVFTRLETRVMLYCKVLTPNSLRSDYLTASYCYCEWPDKRMEDGMGPSHWYQYEYYNKHINMTYILTSACLDRDKSLDVSFPVSDSQNDVPCTPASMDTVAIEATMQKGCRTSRRFENVKQEVQKWGTFCHETHREGQSLKYHIYFNGQQRNLIGGRQKVLTRQQVDQTCDYMCRENMNMTVVKDERFPSSFQAVWELDDMCDECR